MKEKIEDLVIEFFRDYEETGLLRELKEEISANLSARIEDMMKKGISEEEAIGKAFEEFGDIAQVADEMSRQKRNDFIMQAYGKKVPLDKVHAIGYCIAGALTVFGLIAGAVSFLNYGIIYTAIFVFMPFAVLAAGAFTYLGLTQETNVRFAAKNKIGLGYGISAMLITAGVFTSLIVLFLNVSIENINEEGWFVVIENIGIKFLGSLTLLLLGVFLLVFLLIMQKPKMKPWVVKRVEQYRRMHDEKFGLLSGFIWITAFGLFILFGYFATWNISWIVFIFAISAQLILEYFTMKNMK
ncbi:MAG: permease prefix domain 1-containing protein [Elusimicrobiota bacterium]|jgi:MFS family permease|nr:permease prefix domain 1-containing protein [Elusimicrobiota bacterium]